MLKQWMKFMTAFMHTMNSCRICSLVKLEGHIFVAVDFFWWWPVVSAATSVSYKAHLS